MDLVNATILFTWSIMAVLWIASWWASRHITSSSSIPYWQNMLETVLSLISRQIHEVSRQEPDAYLPFIGTIFLFIFSSSIMSIIPGFRAPTASFSTTIALAFCVFFAVPYFGIRQRGLKAYLKSYLQPTILMLPFNIIGEISRTMALSIRLYGNMMSGAVILAILLTLVPLFFPVVLQLLGLITGVIQAYIFAVLALVYITSASQAQKDHEAKKGEPKHE
jgi:F-type H+-transporting ATPase subunit a